MATSSAAQPARTSARVVERLLDHLDRHLSTLEGAPAHIKVLRTVLPADAIALLDAALKAPLSYRDGVFIQLAWGLEEPGFGHTLKGDGARSAAKDFATALSARHIPGVKDAYQNIGKNTTNLARGNVPAFDDLLRWMDTAAPETRERLLDLLSAIVALTARAVLPMPTLATVELSFRKVASLLDDLLKLPSGGAYEQFAVAALLQAVIDQFDMGGVGRLHVKTKNINASDASTGASADVQIMRGSEILEAFEVSASDWRGKVSQAIAAARNIGTYRAHVLAYGDDLAGLDEALNDTTADISVMDVRGFVRLQIGVLKKPNRAAALVRLYELIETNQPDVERVNAYVKLLSRHGLTA